MKKVKKLKYPISKTNQHIDYTIILAYIVLSIIGLVMIYSGSMVKAARSDFTNFDPKFFFNSQIRYVIFGLTLFVIITFFTNTRLYRKAIVPVVLVAGIILFLLMTQIFGTEVNGEKNWLRLGFINLQTSEFVKLVIIMYLAYVYDRRHRVNNRLIPTDVKHLAPFIFMVIIGLWVAYNDFGTSMIIFAIIFSMFFYLNFPKKFSFYVFSGVIGLVALIVGAFIVFKGSFLSDYQLARIDTFFHPFNDPYGEGYQLTNSLIAISNGGLFGQGIGNGILKLGYLPEAQTDFIFSVIAEELGLIGVLVILSLYALIVIKAFYYSSITKDLYLRLVTFGIGIYITVQCFFNIGGASKALPLTGVPLALLSFGGSSFLSISIALAVLSVAVKEIRYRKANGYD